jgi:septation ring formation regulator EzrA
MKFGKQSQESEPPPATQGRPGGGQGQAPRWKKAQREIADLRKRVTLLESELQEVRQLNKRLAEVTDVVAEILLPAAQRDEERLRELLARYESNL